MYNLIESRNRYKELVNKYLPTLMAGHDRAKNEMILANRSCWNKKTYLYYLYFYLQIWLEQELAQGKPYDEVYKNLHLAEFDCLFKDTDKESDIVEPESYIKAEPENWYCGVIGNRSGYFLTGVAYAGTIVYEKYENGRIVDTKTLQILKGNYPDLPEPFIDELNKRVAVTQEEYIARLRYIESLLGNEWDGLGLSYTENYIKSAAEECAQSCYILVVWSNYECLINEETVIDGESFISYKPIKVASGVSAYSYKDESLMKEDINSGTFAQSTGVLQYSLSDMTNAPNINALTVYKNQVLENILKDVKSGVYGDLCSAWAVKEYNSYWENATEECSNEFTATGEWRDKVCYILPDGSFNGECYFLNLVINLNDNK